MNRKLGLTNNTLKFLKRLVYAMDAMILNKRVSKKKEVIDAKVTDNLKQKMKEQHTKVEDKKILRKQKVIEIYHNTFIIRM